MNTNNGIISTIISGVILGGILFMSMIEVFAPYIVVSGFCYILYKLCG